MKWLVDQEDRAAVRNEWGGVLRGGGKNTGMVRAHFMDATLASAPSMQGQRRQEVVYTF